MIIGAGEMKGMILIYTQERLLLGSTRSTRSAPAVGLYERSYTTCYIAHVPDL